MSGWTTHKLGSRLPGEINPRYADNTTLRASEEELKSLLKRVKKKSEKDGLKLNIQKTKIMVSNSITSWQIEGEKSESIDRFSFPGLQNYCEW